MNLFLVFVIGAISFILGRYSFRIQGFVGKVYYYHKHKICWHYRGTGKLENRNGTVSEFCVRCGHPYGYHQ